MKKIAFMITLMLIILAPVVLNVRPILAKPATPIILLPSSDILAIADPNLDEYESPYFDWTDVAGIDYYYVALYDSAWNLVAYGWPTESHWQPNVKLIDGETYHFYVWAHGTDGAWSDPASITFKAVAVPYYPQTWFEGDTIFHLTHCAAATHAMAYNWLKKAGKVANAPACTPEHDVYDDATTSYWPGGCWNAVNWGQVDRNVLTDKDAANNNHLCPGLAYVYGRVMTFKPVVYGISGSSDPDLERAYNEIIDWLRQGHPVEIMVESYAYPITHGAHSILVLYYRPSDGAFYIYNPDPYAPWQIGGWFPKIGWVDKSKILQSWIDLGAACYTVPLGDQPATSKTWSTYPSNPIQDKEWTWVFLWVDGLPNAMSAFLYIKIQHTYIGDLDIYLWVYDDGQWVGGWHIWDNYGGDDDDISLYVALYGSYGALTDNAAYFTSGHWWCLGIYDNYNYDTGTVLEMSIIINGLA